MASDGAFVHSLTAELQQAVGAHIDKIHQPSRYELVLLLRSNNGAKRLLISAVPGQARMHFTETRPENPENPPMFCMLMRKHFAGGKITDISCEGLERIVKITVCAVNEMGDTVNNEIYAELISAVPNIIAVSGGKIIDCVHHSSLESGGRITLPGAVYCPPEKANKYNLLETRAEIITEKITEQKEKTLAAALLNTLEGLSPLICREIAFSVGKDVDFPVKSINSYYKKGLTAALNNLADSIKCGTPQIFTVKNQVYDYSFMPITQYGKAETEVFGSFSALLDSFYGKKTERARLNHASGDILKLLTNAFSRVSRRKSLREADLKKTERREDLRLCGELIKSNIHLISAGQTAAKVQNYYDENLSEIVIPLDPALSPAANAAKYFKSYKKSCAARLTLAELIKEDEEEIEYLDSVLDSLSRCDKLSDIAEIREELTVSGYIKSRSDKKSRAAVSAPLEFLSPSGFKVSVGKNNRQNDELTLHLADKTDLWFHVKDMPGSHTVLFLKGKTPSAADIIFAATKAAEHSKAGKSANVPVNYTEIKFVKKPPKAKAGMVTFSKNRTVFVTPEPNIK